MSVLDIPRSGASLTTEWLREVMHEVLGTPRSALRSATATQIGLGIGIMSESYRVELDWEPEAGQAPCSVVVKLASQAPENRSQGVNLGLYDAETRFYRDLVTSTSARTPGCYFVRKDGEGADFVIIMEDLAALRMVDQSCGLSGGEAEAAVAALAELHASWWGRVTDPRVAWAPSLVHPRIEAMAGVWPELWPVFAERFSGSLSPAALHIGEVVSRHYWQGMEQLSQAPWTLLHMDYRCENLLFDDSDAGADGVVVLDWQTLGRGAGAYDLAYLLGGSLDVESRRSLEAWLVDLYHRRLIDRGVVDYEKETLWDDYRLAHLVAGTATCVLTGATMDLGNDRGRQLIETMTSRHFTAASDLAALDVLDV